MGEDVTQTVQETLLGIPVPKLEISLNVHHYVEIQR